MQPLLLVEDLKISFITNNKPLKVIEDISLQIAHGDVVALVGESGCEKSITALSIMKLLPSNTVFSGRVLFKDKYLLSMRDSELREIRGRDISSIL